MVKRNLATTPWGRWLVAYPNIYKLLYIQGFYRFFPVDYYILRQDETTPTVLTRKSLCSIAPCWAPLDSVSPCVPRSRPWPFLKCGSRMAQNLHQLKDDWWFRSWLSPTLTRNNHLMSCQQSVHLKQSPILYLSYSQQQQQLSISLIFCLCKFP